MSDCKPVVSLPDVEGEGVRLLWGRGDGEGMPLKLSNRRNVEVDIVAGLEGEVGRPLDDEVHHLGGEDDASGDVALALRRNFWSSIYNQRFKSFAPHCKDKIPKFRNKYSQKRNIRVSVPISTFMRL